MVKNQDLAKQFTLGKNERLKSRKAIDLLFSKGQRISVFPFRVFYLLEKNDRATSHLQCGVGVSVKNFKKAVERNQVKRLIREVYRLNKQDLITITTAKQKTLALFFVFIDKSVPTFELLEDRMKSCLKKLQKIVGDSQ